MFAPGGCVVPASVKFHASHLNSVQTATGASLCTTVDFKHSPISGAQTNNISNFYDTFIGWKCLAVNSRTRPHATLVQLLPVCGPSALVFKRKQVQHLTCLNSRGITREQASLADQSRLRLEKMDCIKPTQEQNNKHVSATLKLLTGPHRHEEPSHTSQPSIPECIAHKTAEKLE